MSEGYKYTVKDKGKRIHYANFFDDEDFVAWQDWPDNINIQERFLSMMPIKKDNIVGIQACYWTQKEEED